MSHLINSILGAAIGSIGVIGLTLYLQDSKVGCKAITGMIATVIADTITASIFGAAAFAQPVIGWVFLTRQDNGLDFYNNVYAAPVFMTALISFLLFIIGGIFTGIAIAGPGHWLRWMYMGSSAC